MALRLVWAGRLCWDSSVSGWCSWVLVRPGGNQFTNCFCRYRIVRYVWIRSRKYLISYTLCGQGRTTDEVISLLDFPFGNHFSELTCEVVPCLPPSAPFLTVSSPFNRPRRCLDVRHVKASVSVGTCMAYCAHPTQPGRCRRGDG